MQYTNYLLQVVNTDRKDQPCIPKPHRYARPDGHTPDDRDDPDDDFDEFEE